MAKTKELLAPAGDIEAGYAALYYGADAVYLGLKQFSARATANNFSAQELNEFTGYAHHLRRKVFVTINTVLQESELKDLLCNLEVCRQAKVDALIVQDLGVAGIVKQYYPELALHASTQMAVHNKEGALALQKLGFERVVLARELSLREIQDIATIKGLELECFIHGALCYSYSGICQFSSLDCGRSANRGKCMYPCRAEFSKNGIKSHYFSMKDMALSEDILQLPVYSLKIEGRKKNALYVAAVVDYYRKILDGKKDVGKYADNIKQIFARPWCKFHLHGKDKTVVDRDYVGHRGLAIGKVERAVGRKIIIKPTHKIARYDGLQIDIIGEEKPFGFALQNMRIGGKSVFEAKAGETVEVILPEANKKIKSGMPVYLASASEVKGAYNYSKPKPKEFWQKPKVDVKVKIEEHRITVSCGEVVNQITGDFGLARNPEKMMAAIREVFAKTGDELFDLGELAIENKASLFVPLSVLNELRRGLYAKIKIAEECVIINEVAPRKTRSDRRWIIKIDDSSKCQKIDFGEVDEIGYLLNENTTKSDITILPKSKIRIALPTICRNVAKMKLLIDELLGMGYKKWEINNYWGITMLPEKGIDLCFGNMIYMFNTQAIAMAKDMGATRITLPVEDTADNMRIISQKSSLPVAVTVWQNVPLFISAVCVRDNDCAKCNRKLQWSVLEKDGKNYRVRSENCQTMVFSESPFCAISELSQLNVEYAIADFCYMDYSADAVADIWQKLLNGEEPLFADKANLQRNVF